MNKNLNTRIIFDSHPRTSAPSNIMELVNYFDKNLSNDWDIFIQPYLNGLQPDLVLINDNFGMHIIECKSESKISISRLKIIQEGIKDLYCPRAFIDQKQNKSNPAIFFLFADISRPLDELKNEVGYSAKKLQNFSILSNDFMQHSIDELIISMDKNKKFHFNAHYAEDLRAWLRCSDYKLSFNQPLPKLDSRQLDLVNRESPKFLKICGSAGSGKTMILAAKAAKLLCEQKRVLVLTFNITLINYIRNLIHQNLNEISNDKIPSSINYSISWFHRFAKTNLVNLGWESDYKDLWDRSNSPTDVLNNKMAALLKQLSDDESIPENYKFDAILIDEGQDFLPNWWDSVKPFLAENGNAFFAYDFRQDVYNRLGAWQKEKFSMSGFVGRPNELKLAYRMPNAYIPKIKKFIENFLQNQNDINGQFEDLIFNLPEPAKQQDMLEQCNTSWIQVEDESIGDEKSIEAILDYSKVEVDDFTYSGLLFLTTSKQAGIRICRKLKAMEVRVTDTFDSNGETERGKKTSFNLHNDPIKATHVYSGKGLESSQIILQITKNSNRSDVYTGLTRLKMGSNSQCSIIVICSNPLYKNFGSYFNS